MSQDTSIFFLDNLSMHREVTFWYAYVELTEISNTARQFS